MSKDNVNSFYNDAECRNGLQETARNVIGLSCHIDFALQKESKMHLLLTEQVTTGCSTIKGFAEIKSCFSFKTNKYLWCTYVFSLFCHTTYVFSMDLSTIFNINSFEFFNAINCVILRRFGYQC